MTLLLSADRARADLASVSALIDTLPGFDPLGRLSLEAYRELVDDAMEAATTQAAHAAQVELTVGGEPVAGGTGIHAAFLADALGGLQELLARVCGTRGASHLFVTGLSQQPAGVVLQEVDEAGDLLFPSPLRRAVQDVIAGLATLTHGSDDDFGEWLERFEPRVIKAARDFVGRLCRHEGTFRLAQGEQAVSVDRDALERAWRRLESTHVDEHPLRTTGRLLGLMPLARRFEFQPDDGRPTLSGRVGEEVSAHYLAQLEAGPVAGRRWSAVVERVTIERPGQPALERYTLLALEPAADLFARG